MKDEINQKEKENLRTDLNNKCVELEKVKNELQLKEKTYFEKIN